MQFSSSNNVLRGGRGSSSSSSSGFGLYSLKNPAAAAAAVSLFTSPSVVNTKLKSGSSSSPSAVVHAVLHQYQGDDSHATAPLLRQRRPFNVPGNFFVDHTCIDCDTCRWMAPGTFTRVDDEMSAVPKQPISEEEALKSLQAFISCPTASIHTDKPDRAILQVQETFPIPIDSEHIPVASLSSQRDLLLPLPSSITFC